MTIRWAVLALWAAIAAAFGCGDDDFGPYEVVGGTCRGDLDCAPGAQCQRGGPFPDGTCTLPCNGHEDCPPVSACVEEAGGICLVSCANDSYCRERYKCKDRKDGDGVGSSLVCINK